ncbi:hypothetical protein L1887_31738 [Cichorium endivia]|nr:hypothetical protein L1887_31738 [Cichorium endivia]
MAPALTSNSFLLTTTPHTSLASLKNPRRLIVCAKKFDITGKAVMLDEIINYVQSLQQQVEFLSMKLATANPELNIDIDRLVFKDILHSRGSTSNPAFGFGPSSHSYPHGSLPSTAPIILFEEIYWSDKGWKRD